MDNCLLFARRNVGELRSNANILWIIENGKNYRKLSSSSMGYVGSEFGSFIFDKLYFLNMVDNCCSQKLNYYFFLLNAYPWEKQKS